MERSTASSKDWIKENQELVESWKNKRQTRNKCFQNWIKYPNLEACSSLSFVYKRECVAHLRNVQRRRQTIMNLWVRVKEIDRRYERLM